MIDSEAQETVRAPSLIESRTMDSADRVRVPATCFLVVVILVGAAWVLKSRVVEIATVIASAILLPYVVQSFLFAGRELWFVEATPDFIVHRQMGHEEIRILREQVAQMRFVGGPSSENGCSVWFTMKNGTESSMTNLESELFVKLKSYVRHSWTVVIHEG